jgi:hypothetical protein
MPTLKYYPDMCKEQLIEEMKHVHTHSQIRTLFILISHSLLKMNTAVSYYNTPSFVKHAEER